MKRIDIFCASQASTAICMSMDQPSSSSSSSASSSSNILLGGRAIDRYNPIIRDQRRTPRPLPTVPCISQPPPISPTPDHLLHKSKKGSSSSNKENVKSKKSSQTPIDQKAKKISSKPNEDANKGDPLVAKESGRRSWAKRGDFFTPPGSSRYLLSDTALFDRLPDYDPVLSMVPADSNTNKELAVRQDQPSASKPSSSSRSERPTNQVVVLRVSLHCKGCEGKVRKHLSRMEGVTSFNIDFAAKKVTIVGDVTPLGVLASVSKVKNAQFWPVATPADGSKTAEVKK